MKKNILLVDDDQLFLGVTARGIENVDPEFHVIAEQEGQQAIGHMKSEKIELLITDLIMPSMCGCDLIIYMLNNKIFMPVIVMSGYVVEKEKPFSHLGGTCSYLTKPIRARTLVDEIKKCIERNTAKQDNSVSLITIVQLFALEQRTCTIEICGDSKKGTIVFSKGKMKDIELGDCRGEEALSKMFLWKDVYVEIVNKRK
jgi:DNA-binding NtrC family response regulator